MRSRSEEEIEIEIERAQRPHQHRLAACSLDTSCSHITVDKTLDTTGRITVDARPGAVSGTNCNEEAGGWPGCRDTGPSAGLKGAGLATSRGASDPRPLLRRAHRVAWCRGAGSGCVQHSEEEDHSVHSVVNGASA